MELCRWEEAERAGHAEDSGAMKEFALGVICGAVLGFFASIFFFM